MAPIPYKFTQRRFYRLPGSLLLFAQFKPALYACNLRVVEHRIWRRTLFASQLAIVRTNGERVPYRISKCSCVTQ
jgi:hypothetical protein